MLPTRPGPRFHYVDGFRLVLIGRKWAILPDQDEIYFFQFGFRVGGEAIGPSTGALEIAPVKGFL
jgi:hypothetical protein